MKIDGAGLWTVLKTTCSKWLDRDPFRESAVIAYNAIFSLPGLLVLVLFLAEYFFGEEVVNGRLHAQVAAAMGMDTANQVQTMMVEAYKSKDSIWATIIGIVSIIIGATGVFVQLQKSLNSIWEVEPKVYKSGFWAFLYTRLFSFGLIISIAFLLLVSLVISSVLSAFGTWVMSHWSESFVVILNIFNELISLAIITLLFAAMYRILPDAQIQWRTVWVGAFCTALLFVAGKYALGLYFGKAEPGSGYGAAGSVILILLWVSYSSLIVFFGAQFTREFTRHFFGNPKPMDHARRVTAKKALENTAL